MIGSLDLSSGQPLELDGRHVSVARGTDGQDDVTLECGDRRVQLRTADLHGADGYVDYWCQPNRYCIVASHTGSAVIRVDLDVCSLVEVARLDRPVVTGYDPGGLERVRFIETPSGLAIVTESSAMLFDERGALVWHRPHGVLVYGEVSLSPDGILVFQDDAVAFGYRLADGRLVEDWGGDRPRAGGESSR